MKRNAVAVASSSRRGRVTGVLVVMVVGGLLAGLGSSFAASDQPGVPASSMPPSPSAPPLPAPPQATTQPLSAQNLEAWHGPCRGLPCRRRGASSPRIPAPHGRRNLA